MNLSPLLSFDDIKGGKAWNELTDEQKSALKAAGLVKGVMPSKTERKAIEAMGNNIVTLSKDVIIKYLEYLRDISRKIISARGFEKALIDKSKNNRAFTIQIKEEVNSFIPTNTSFDNIKQSYYYLLSNLDKRLFCGIGLICGKKNEKTFAGPIFYLECNITEQNSNEYMLDYDYSSINLNYDLFSYLFTISNADEDDDGTNIVFDNESQIINEIERDIQEMKDKAKANLKSLTEYVNNIFTSLKEKLDTFKSINIFMHGYDFIDENKLYAKRTKHNNNRTKSIFESDLCYVDAIHLFVSQIPDQLSTYEALRRLIAEVEQHDFKSPALDMLLKNALTEVKVELNMNDTQIDMKENYLPVPLSGPQETALRLAWTKKISYIQGPPGTGKSHTISAIVISAVLNNKRVLVVSQKQPALKVVKEKVEPLLKYSENKDIQGMIYFDKDGKKKIRDHIKELTSIANNINTLFNNNIVITEESLKEQRYC
ncbi:MAG: hypothetical protein HQL01_11665 [Nitrospirae bacterium]|nr:hypothetical protein [Nitrospirota bacterium]